MRITIGNGRLFSRYTTETALAVFRRCGGVLRANEAIRQGIHPRTLYALRDSGVIQSLKSVADSWKYLHKLSLDVALEALKLYCQRRDFDVTKLVEYARRGACRVERVIRPYLEALL